MSNISWCLNDTVFIYHTNEAHYFHGELVTMNAKLKKWQHQKTLISLLTNAKNNDTTHKTISDINIWITFCKWCVLKGENRNIKVIPQ